MFLGFIRIVYLQQIKENKKKREHNVAAICIVYFTNISVKSTSTCHSNNKFSAF